MEEVKKYEQQRSEIIKKYMAVNADKPNQIPADKQADFKVELKALNEEFKDIFSDFSDKNFMIDQVGMLTEQTEQPDELVVYEDLQKLEEAKTIHDKQYRIEVEVLDEGRLPCKAHKTDAGFDLFATDDITVYPGSGFKHPLNIKMHLPAGAKAQIESKSGLGSRGLLVYAGVIDETYRGVPHVVAAHIRFDLKPITIKKGQKVAQMTMSPHSNEYYMVEVEAVSEDTDRGAGGFGSSGE